MILKSAIYSHPDKQGYPFSLPILNQWTGFEFNSPITVFVGDNGSGKSTILHTLAAKSKARIIAGSDWNDADHYKEVLTLSNHVKLSWKHQSNNGFFLRSDDFISFIRRLKDMKREAKMELEAIEGTYSNKSILAKQLASSPHLKTLAELNHLYGDGLETRSHGESFLDFFHSRLRANSLYFLDEPETPLSPAKQLAFMSLILEYVNKGSQFIIVTHSPILMALPGASIYSFQDQDILPLTYDELEHVQLTRDFLNAPERFTRHLLSEE
ncbi:AAA family ATPase [Peribacillus alkalitolerans]|uniref:AAA family ATPase n=1 Tax=Peribacillus alkalitolerans TaxID=1550385 RepID=UPI0013D4A580|nr:AAA family ATPase [Peribacillus alkalitolerans]